MIVMINTDASYHPEHKVGAYAFTISCELFNHEYSGVLKQATSAEDAEIRCIFLAILKLKTTQRRGITKVIINSDALWVFKKIYKGTKHPIGIAIVNLLTEMRRKNIKGQTYKFHQFVYVKGHSQILDTPEKVSNHWCDKEARKQMQEEVKRLMTVTQ